MQERSARGKGVQTRARRAVAALTLALAACSAPVAVPVRPPAAPTNAPRQTLLPTPAPEPRGSSPLIAPGQARFEGLVDIGGRSLFLDCAGVGQPTIIFDADLATPGARSTLFLPFEFEDVTRLCYYDRAGVITGRSDRVRSARTSQDAADDLGALLSAAGLAPPWILVGAGYGGMNVTLFATQHADEVAGVVLLDPLPPGTIEAWIAAVDAGRPDMEPLALGMPLSRLADHPLESVSFAASTAQLQAAWPVQDVPVIVFAASDPVSGWVHYAPDPALRAALADAWSSRRAFYAGVSQHVAVVELDDMHSFPSAMSRDRISAALAGLIDLYYERFDPPREPLQTRQRWSPP